MWRIAAGLKSLDVNSPYAYLLICRDFSATSAVAVDDDQVVGFLSGYCPTRAPDTFFVWQVAVAESHQGSGIAKQLLSSILVRPELGGVQYVEATVSPGNVPSQRLFTSLASRLGTECEVTPLFPSSMFPDPSHADEELYRIGPIPSLVNAGLTP